MAVGPLLSDFSGHRSWRFFPSWQRPFVESGELRGGRLPTPASLENLHAECDF
uniref:Alternative protein HMGCL n=1 Tax=Homo sapiens TaxID=9606 RepID=L8EC54_HUMAN|nr:alternative protein HMGCL [Homo sapiens]